MYSSQGRQRRFAVIFACFALAFALSCFVGVAGASAASCAVPSGTYATVNSALADNSCNPINVAAGTYDETLDITRNVTIHGAGSASTTIAPTSKPNEIVGIRNAATVSIDGFTIRYPHGFYVDGYPSVQSIGVHVYEGAAAEVFNNVITEIHNDVINGNQTGHCVMVGNNSPASTATVNLHDNTITYCQKQGVSVRANSTVTIDNNEIAYGNQGDQKQGSEIYAGNGIVLNSGVTSTITGNDIHDWICTQAINCGDTLNDTQSLGLLPFGTQASMTVTGNNVHDNDAGFFQYQSGAAQSTVTNNTFSNNDVYNAALYGGSALWQDNTLSNGRYGVLVYGDPAVATNLVLDGDNMIDEASISGMLVDAGSTTVNISGSKNSFIENANGIDTGDATTADLECNWWGSASGPTIGTNPGGTGDQTSNGTDYSPWAYDDEFFACGSATPQGTLSFASTEIPQGSTTALLLTLTNTNSDPIPQTSGSFMIPPGISVTAVASNSCGGDVNFSGQTVSFSGAMIPASGACVITFTVAGVTPGTHDVTLPVGDVLSPRGNSTETSTTTLTVTPSGDPAPVADPIPACVGKELLISDVAMSSGKVRVKGYARLKYAGQKVALRFKITGAKIVGYATVKSDGSWSTLLKAPPRRQRYAGNARYQAAIGNGTTQWIKLMRRMGSTSVVYDDGKLSVTGSAKKPLTPGARVAVTLSFDCNPYGTVGTLPSDPKTGRFAGFVPIAQRNTVALARLRVRVRRELNGKHTFSTYSILQPVVIK
jgi:parallel beta-helix repeat protein